MTWSTVWPARGRCRGPWGATEPFKPANQPSVSDAERDRSVKCCWTCPANRSPPITSSFAPTRECVDLVAHASRGARRVRDRPGARAVRRSFADTTRLLLNSRKRDGMLASCSTDPTSVHRQNGSTQRQLGAPLSSRQISHPFAPFPSCLPALHSSDCESFRCRCGEIVRRHTRESRSTLSLALAQRFSHTACTACVKHGERH